MAVARKNIYKSKVLLVAGLLIVATTLYEYFEGYKNHHIISGASFFFNFLSWTVIWHMLFNKQLEGKMISFNHNKNKWLKQKLTNTWQYIILCLFIFSNLYIAHELGHKRVVNILNNEPTKTTQATIVSLEYRWRRHGTDFYVIFTYNTDKGVVEQARSNNKNKFYVGETYEVTYSVEYPEMYRIGKQIKNNPD